MNYMDIPNYYIVGTASNSGTGGGGGHAWNAVSANDGDTYLYMDLTWDDLGEDGYTYAYFGMPATDFESTHAKDGPDGGEDGSQWLYEITGTFSDSFEGTYYNKGGFYCDGTGDVEALASSAAAKASRVGDFVSFLAPNLNLLGRAAKAVGVSELVCYTVSYKDKKYYYTSIRMRAHTHDWGEPKYTWSEDNNEVTATRICLAAHCDVRTEEETVSTTKDVIEEATCTEEGLTIYTAEFENEAFTIQTKDVTEEALGHKWGVWVVEKEATEDEPGLRVRTCRHDPSHTQEEEFSILDPPIPEHIHVMEEHVAVTATCTEPGNTAYWECEECGEYFADEEGIAEIEEDSWILDPLGHDIIHHDAKAATCVDAGWEEYETCSRCDYTTYEEIEATGEHTWQPHRVAPGLLKDGQQYEQCSVCGAKQNVKTLAGYATYYVKSFKVSKGKKSFTAKWAKQSAANQKKFNGYQIRYSLKSNMAGAKYAKAAKSSKSKKIGKLLKKKKYYVQVRTYTVKGGKTYYSKWSAKKAVKTK